MGTDLRDGWRRAQSQFQSILLLRNKLENAVEKCGGNERVILLLVDGLGYMQLDKFRAHARNLWRWVKDSSPALSTAPTTTATAITAVSTGASPAHTNMIGYSAYAGGKVFNLLNFSGANPSLEIDQWQPESTIFENLNLVETQAAAFLPRKYFGSGLTSCALRGAKLEAVTGLGDAVAQAVQQHYKFSYLYYSELDAAGHKFGVGSAAWLAALEELDSQVSILMRMINPGTRVFLVADHGMVNADLSQQIDLAAYPHLTKKIAAVYGEPRALHIRLKLSENIAQFVADARGILPDRAAVLSGAEINEIFGGANALVGDVVVFSAAGDTVIDSRVISPAARTLPGVHGSLTLDEGLIPFLWLN